VTWAVWLTGPPASGKSTVARALADALQRRSIRTAVLESDALRAILTPGATYEPAERDRFYAEVADLATLLVRQGVPVIVDATAPRRAHRERLRRAVPDLVEVLVATPREICERRDPKGLYARARGGDAPHLPGATEAYEEPEKPDVVVSGTAPPEESACAILRALEARVALGEN
jgi:adenylylsulfate kinase-like enzyme